MPAKRESYIYIDGGIRQDGSPVRGAVELPAFTCVHCGTIVVMNMARTRPRGYCAKCDAWTCDNVVCSTECHPIMQGVELAQKYVGTDKANQPFLLRGPRGEILFDPELESKEKIF